MDNKICYGYFNNKEIELPYECVLDCSHQGQCYDDVKYWQSKLNLELDRQFMIDGLLEYGAWNKEELNELDDSELEYKVIWLISHDIKKELSF